MHVILEKYDRQYYRFILVAVRTHILHQGITDDFCRFPANLIFRIIIFYSIGRTGRIGNPGHAISFFDPAYDTNMAGSIKKVLETVSQTVPDWLVRLESGSSGGDDFASEDTRTYHAQKVNSKNNF